MKEPFLIDNVWADLSNSDLTDNDILKIACILNDISNVSKWIIHGNLRDFHIECKLNRFAFTSESIEVPCSFERIKNISKQLFHVCQKRSMKYMTFDEYQEWCVTKWKTENTLRDQRIECSMGLSGESGEFLDYVKKYAFHEHPLILKKAHGELGDIAYYLAQMCTLTGVKLSDVIQQNVDKLNARYPNGFEKSRSINRDE